jgi:hypothetical protein
MLPGSFVPPTFDPVDTLERHLASGWDYQTDVVIFAGLEELDRQVAPALGRLERIDDATTRLCGTTSNPRWYVEQLVCIRSPFRIAGCDMIRDAALDLGHRLVEAASPLDDSDPTDKSRAPILGGAVRA